MSRLCSVEHAHFSHATDLYHLVDEYQETLSRLIDHHAPIKEKFIRTRSQVPWYNEEIAKAKKERRKAERVWRRSGHKSDFAIFKKKKNHATYIINKARKAFYSAFIDSNSEDQGKVFRNMKKLLAPSQRLLFPDYDDHQSLVNDIGKFFCHKIHHIISALDSSEITLEEKAIVPEDPLVGEEKKLPNFRQLSSDEVRALVRKTTKKTCSLDPMPTSMVVACLDGLLPTITCILNSSLVLGHFPLKWKDALLDPRLKSGKDISFPNLRPVSNLQYISKLTERAVYDQTHDHMLQYELCPLLQSAYRVGHSTGTALLKVQNDILLNMDRSRVTLLVHLDLSAAFDTVDHQVLLRRLESSFGITGTALSWFSSYLPQRSQRICYEGCTSKTFHLLHGVPQGS